MDELLQYMAVDLDESTRKVALSSQGFCCDDELTTMRSVTTLATWTNKPVEHRYQAIGPTEPKEETLGENID